MGHADLNNPEWLCICCRHTASHHRKMPGPEVPSSWPNLYCNATLGMTAGTGSGGSDQHCGCAKYVPESNFSYLKRTQREQRITV